jgi:phosphoadenosine phosphosulfate reductase
MEIRGLVKEFENKPAEEILRWALDTFKGKVALANSFGAEDVVLTDMFVKIDPKVKIFTLDTGRLPQEIYDVWERIEGRYGIRIEPYFPDARSVEAMVREHGPNLFYKNVELRKLCCKLRKVEPLKRALSGLDAWICGLRREQSITRENIKKIELDKAHGEILKINPLADWTIEQVWDYIMKNDVPYNKLHDRDYPSIGCAPCTRAVKPGEDIRAGRWWWEKLENKECGLHCPYRIGKE